MHHTQDSWCDICVCTSVTCWWRWYWARGSEEPSPRSFWPRPASGTGSLSLPHLASSSLDSKFSKKKKKSIIIPFPSNSTHCKYTNATFLYAISVCVQCVSFWVESIFHFKAELGFIYIFPSHLFTYSRYHTTKCTNLTAEGSFSLTAPLPEIQFTGFHQRPPPNRLSFPQLTAFRGLERLKMCHVHPFINLINHSYLVRAVHTE